MSRSKVTIFWFRRDLRLEDNVGFFKVLNGNYPVLPLFIFDTNILQRLPKNDARVNFIHDTLQQMKVELQSLGSDLGIYHGHPKDVFERVCRDFDVQHIVCNRDYEPYALKRDAEILKFLEGKAIGFHTFKDQVLFEMDEVVKVDGSPYVVYTPYMKAWMQKCSTLGSLKAYDPKPHYKKLLKGEKLPNLDLKAIGFENSVQKVKPYTISENTLTDYEKTRNFPAMEYGTTHLSPHLRFGTIGYRSLLQKAQQSPNTTFLKELIWREFFMQILWHFPHTTDKAFKSQYDRIVWRNNENEFEKWKAGKTGYPLVDAGMRELNSTGYMHNRVRMVVASFLCKHLLIDWRWGETYFAEKLLDYELSSNVGNWQWAAGSGVDAAPYFRIFNPTSQIEKFDKDHKYLKKWIPEWGSEAYPAPIVEHKMARERCLSAYKAALEN